MLSSRDEVQNVLVKGLFSVSTTSTKPPYIIKDEIERVLGNLKVQYIISGFDFLCIYTFPDTDSEPEDQTENENNPDLQDFEMDKKVVKFELSIVKVQLLNLHGLFMKRVSGDAWTYKNICTQILKDAKL